MAVNDNVHQGDIIEVDFILPGGIVKKHPALVVSEPIKDAPYKGRNGKFYDEFFYVLLISSKNYSSDHCVEIKPEWVVGTPLEKQSYFVTHIISACRYDSISCNRGTCLNEDAFNEVLDKILENVFNVTFG